jgi:hypothetical protein
LAASAPKVKTPSPLSSFLLIRKLIGETHLIFGIGDIFVAWGGNKQTTTKNDFVLCENITTLKMKKNKKITTLCQIHRSREVATALIGGSCCCFFIVSCYSKRERKKKQSRDFFIFLKYSVLMGWRGALVEKGGPPVAHVWLVQSAVIDWRSPDASFVSLLFLLLISFPPFFSSSSSHPKSGGGGKPPPLPCISRSHIIQVPIRTVPSDFLQRHLQFEKKKNSNFAALYFSKNDLPLLKLNVKFSNGISL